MMSGGMSLGFEPGKDHLAGGDGGSCLAAIDDGGGRTWLRLKTAARGKVGNA
jgi:hypothetical protein